tara:strand:- start:156 stop:350 length:195 start_codon:yes stop_codon:yes gene_type:complete
MTNPLQDRSVWISEKDTRDIIEHLDYFLFVDPPHEDVQRIEEIVISLRTKLKLKDTFRRLQEEN